MITNNLSFTGNLANSYLQSDKLKINDVVYSRGDKAALFFDEKNSPTNGIPIEILDFEKMPKKSSNKLFANSTVLTYKNLSNGEIESTLPAVPFAYNLYNSVELRKKIIHHQSVLDTYKDICNTTNKAAQKRWQG